MNQILHFKQVLQDEVIPTPVVGYCIFFIKEEKSYLQCIADIE
jgi:hypothetical protein